MNNPNSTPETHDLPQFHTDLTDPLSDLDTPRIHQHHVIHFRELEKGGAYYYFSVRLNTVVGKVDRDGEATEAPELADSLTPDERAEMYAWVAYRVAGGRK